MLARKTYFPTSEFLLKWRRFTKFLFIKMTTSSLKIKKLKALVDPMHRAHLQHIIIIFHFPTNLKHLIEHKGHWVQFKEENLGLQDTCYTF